mmetsp:Transcript_26035/g.29803  ORF Transcript_26035/g.29803 Transcript_26035/m.29803 type:complete len:83 (+) Transcript_26035:380-628(+)
MFSLFTLQDVTKAITNEVGHYDCCQAIYNVQETLAHVWLLTDFANHPSTEEQRHSTNCQRNKVNVCLRFRSDEEEEQIIEEW